MFPIILIFIALITNDFNFFIWLLVLCLLCELHSHALCSFSDIYFFFFNGTSLYVKKKHVLTLIGYNNSPSLSFIFFFDF